MADFGWARGFPDGCTSPEHTGDPKGKPHAAKGLCRTCYKREMNREAARAGVQDPPLAVPSIDESIQLPLEDVGVPDPVADGPADEAPLTTPGERRPGSVGPPTPSPASADSGPTSKIKRLFGKKDDNSGVIIPTPVKTKEKRPGGGSLRGRVSAADTIADVWAAGGTLAARSPKHVPLGRYMQWQSPVAGEMLDDAVKGSVVDRLVLQRVVKARGRLDLAGAVLLPPLLIYMIENNPAMMPTLGPILESQIRNSLPLMVPAIKKMKAKAKASEEAAAELFADDPDFNPNEDPVKQILEMIFAGYQPPAPVPTEDPVDVVA